MIIRWFGIGFVLWLALTLAFRYVSDDIFTQGIGGVSWLALGAPPAMFIVTFVLLRVLRVAPTDRAEAATLFALPGFLIGIYEINSFSLLFPNLESLSSGFAAMMYSCYAAAMLAGVASSRLRMFGGGRD
jgi:signal transduction histidine kinase